MVLPAGHDTTAPPAPFWVAAIDYAKHKPARLLVIVLCLHLLVWTLLPLLLSPNLQLDLIEGLAFGKEWQLGYWKHPPLPWWVTDAVFRVTGSVDSVYVLGPVAIIACMVGVWLLAREMVGQFEALIAVLALEGIHFYNYSAVKFAHDQMQLPFWVFTSLFFYRAIVHGRISNWALAGVFLAGAFWSKYAAVVLAASLGLFLVFDPVARRAWRTAGPYVMAVAFVIAIAPNAWWLVAHDFMPFDYVDERAKLAAHWYDHFVFPMQWLSGAALPLLPAVVFLSLLFQRGKTHILAPASEIAAFNRRYITLLTLGPLLLTTLISVVLGRLAITMWAYPFWSFAPLAVLLWIGPPTQAENPRRLAAVLAGLLMLMPLAYIAVEFVEPRLRDRTRATQIPAAAVADHVTHAWHDAFGTPLAYVGGSGYVANAVAVYSPDRPHVMPLGDPKLAPWIGADDLARRGAVLVWEEHLGVPPLSDRWLRAFPLIDIQPLLVLQRQTRQPGRPARIYFAFVAPRQ